MKEENNQEKVSFRGEPIPEVIKRIEFTPVDSETIMNKIKMMTDSDRESLTIEAVHYGDGGISDIKLSNGDIVSIETAIALAEHHMIKGYTTGATFKGGRILRSLPDQSNDHVSRIHDLPTF